MIIDQAPKGSGKTTRALNWAKLNPGGVIVVPDLPRKVVLISRIEKDESLSEKIKKDLRSHVVTADHLLKENGYLISNARAIYLDDADEILQKIFHYRLSGMSMTKG
jgi:hypothetical protein